MPSNKSREPVEVDVEVIRRSDAALLVNDGNVEVWIPFSLILEDSEIDRTSDVGDDGVLIIPEWEAYESNLI